MCERLGGKNGISIKISRGSELYANHRDVRTSVGRWFLYSLAMQRWVYGSASADTDSIGLMFML